MKISGHILLRGLFLSLMAVGILQAQVREESILKRNIKIDIRASIWEATHALADKGIPIGIETREGRNVDTDPRVEVCSGTVEEYLLQL